MFALLKGGKANLQLVLDRQSPPYLFGETIHAKLTVTGEKDLKIEEGRIVLLYHEEYQFRRRHVHRDSKGHTSTREESVWTTDEREVKREVFAGQTTIPGGGRQTLEFQFPIPLNAAPTAEGGKIVRIKWLVKATLDRRMAGDTEAIVEVPVMTAPPGQLTQAGVYGVSSEPAEADLSLSWNSCWENRLRDSCRCAPRKSSTFQRFELNWCGASSCRESSGTNNCRQFRSRSRAVIGSSRAALWQSHSGWLFRRLRPRRSRRPIPGSAGW